MERKNRLLFCLMLAFVACCTVSCTNKSGKAENDIIPGGLWHDVDGNPINAHGGGILYHEGRYFWYGECKGDSTYRLERVKSWECWRADAQGVSCYSSADLLHWKFEGMVLSSLPQDSLSDLHPSQIIERPKVLYNEKTRKFVLWMHIDSPDYGKGTAGVAVSDSPTGPFTYLGSFKPNGLDSRDQTLFKDTDGRAYHICSTDWNESLMVSLLTDDYTKPSGEYRRILLHQKREAPAVFKRNKKYYLLSSGCTGWDPNKASYAVADSMLGVWTTREDPCTGKDADKTFYAQSTFVLQIVGEDKYMAMFDRWKKTDLIHSSYIWLPVEFDGSRMTIPWKDSWSLNLKNTK